jgi:hypothetical protein
VLNAAEFRGKRHWETINLTPNFTTIITGYGNIKTYLHKYKIIESPMCSCGGGEQTVDHIILDCELVEQERHRLKAEELRTENWPVTEEMLINKYSKYFKKFTDSMSLDKL